MPETLRLLGPPRLERGGELVTIPVKQTLLLGAYLAYREDWVPRSELLALFWPDEDERTARHNLSQLLYHSKRQSWFAGLETERERVRWPVATDVRALREALGGGDWSEAVQAYTGELLEGIEAPSVRYEDWLLNERRALFGQWRDAALQRARALEASGDAAAAARLLGRVIAADPLAEDALQAFMRAAAAAGRREEALRAFEAFALQLREELDLEPLDATRRLAETIRGAGTDPAAPEEAQAAPKPRRAFPDEPHTFVGRDAELADLAGLLRGGARMLTLVGPGGMGKTRLALRLADALADDFGEGAAFVALADLDSPAQVAPAALAALGLEPNGGDPPERQLARWLAGRSLLLVFDNAEHLVRGLGELHEWLEGAPALRMIVTSRAPLELPLETRYAVGGLDAGGGAPSEAPSDAVALLLQAAHRADARYRLPAEQQADATRLARTLEGMPLALELAAPWLLQLSPAEIAAEVEREATLLARADPTDATGSDGAPERHRSVAAAFEHSWALLSDGERDALARLAVFAGGADRAAAATVADADLRTLLALVTKSLLRRDERGRFVPHVLIRQLAERKLAARDERAARRAAHAAHFAALIEEALPELKGEEQAAWLQRMAAEHANTRAALRWFAANDPAAGLRPAGSLFRYWWLRGHYREGLALIEALLERTPPRDPPDPERVRAQQAAGNLTRLCNDLPGAVARLEQALMDYEALGDRRGTATALGNLAMIDRIQGRIAQARERLERVLAIQRGLGDRSGQANTLNNLAAIAMSAGDDPEAERLNRDSLELARAVGDPFVEARALGNLGGFALERGDLDDAEALHREALRAFEAMGYPVGIAVTQQSLGNVAAARGEPAAAFGWWRRALLRFVEIDDRRGVAEILLPLGRAAAERGDAEAAARFGAASEALFAAIGVAPMPFERSDHEALRELAGTLGARGEALRTEGAAWSVETATAEALAYAGAAAGEG